MLKESLHYTKIADGIVIDLLLGIGNVPQKIIELFSHVLSAQHVWASRILSLTPKYSPFDIVEVKSFKEISTQNFILMEEILTNLSLEKQIEYSNSKGEKFVNRVDDILFHAINHSTYHRAQIASILKQNNIEPPITDYILLKRDNKL